MSMRIALPIRIKAVSAKCSNCGFRVGRIPLWSVVPYNTSIMCPICGEKGVDTKASRPFTHRDAGTWPNLLRFWDSHLVPGLKYDTHKWVLDTVDFDQRKRTANSRRPE